MNPVRSYSRRPMQHRIGPKCHRWIIVLLVLCFALDACSVRGRGGSGRGDHMGASLRLPFDFPWGSSSATRRCDWETEEWAVVDGENRCVPVSDEEGKKADATE